MEQNKFLIYKKMGEESKKSTGKGWLMGISILLFLIDAWKFVINPGSEVPILTILFNMVIYLAIIILILHKDEMKFYGYFQNHI